MKLESLPLILAALAAASPTLAAPPKRPPAHGASAKALAPEELPRADAPSTTETLEEDARLETLIGIDHGGAHQDAAARDRTAAAVARLVALAQEHHPALKTAAARQAVAAAKAETSRAGYFPALSVTASATRSESRDDRTPVGRSETMSRSVGARVTQNLYRGGNDARQVEAARWDVRIEDAGARSTAEKVRIDVTRAALEYNDAVIRQAIARSSLESSGRLRDIAARKQGAGLVGRIDIETARLQELEAATELRRLDTEIAQKRAALADALNLDPADAARLETEFAALTEASFPVSPEPPAGQASALARIREDRQVAERAKADVAVAAARAERWSPVVDVYAGVAVGRQDSKLNGLGGTAADSGVYRPRTEVGLELSWPLFAPKTQGVIGEQVATRAQVEAAQAEQNASARAQRDQWARQVVDLYALRGEYDNLYRVARSVHEAQRNLYQAGAAGIDAVVNANLTRLSALRNVQKLHFEINAAILNWQQSHLGATLGAP